MAETTPDNSGEWEKFRAGLRADPENREVYDRALSETVALRKILQQVESARVSEGISKAELAQRAGMNPASIRRLLTSETANPTIKTMLGVFDALGLEVTLTHKKRRRARRPGSAAADESASRSAAPPTELPVP
jgi:DNA-binding phage protein